MVTGDPMELNFEGLEIAKIKNIPTDRADDDELFLWYG